MTQIAGLERIGSDPNAHAAPTELANVNGLGHLYKYRAPNGAFPPRGADASDKFRKVKGRRYRAQAQD